MSDNSNFYKNHKDAVAIIGMGCRFPGGSNDVEKFWDVLANGKDVVVEIPENRWDRKSFYNKNRNYKGKTVSQYGGFLDNIDEFDAEFFGITPREAPFLDPQQRLLLETSWEAMEDAGIVVEKCAGKDVGVYMGAFTLDYKILQFGSENYDLIDVHTATGAMMTMVANRISYAFDFTGPSMAIDTACSSSLVSIHTACQSIRNGECSMALAGGVLLNMAPQYTIAESQGGFLSVDGKCKTFDESANGYVRGEGVGVVVLKPLAEAIKDNDNIYSVILGSAVNQDGHTSSITVPNPEAQKKVIRAALKSAKVDAKDIQYVEMHGTGTSVGDPLEAEAISEIMSEGRDANKPCIVGSLKTNIGHTEGAAGVASIIKTSLCLTKKEIPPHLNLNKLNPKINLEEKNICVSKTLQQWPKTEGVALAGVNGFGFGGTNSHVVLAEAPEKKVINSDHKDEIRLFPITARSEAALRDYVENYKELLEKNENVNTYDLGYSMSYKRDRHNHRLAFMAANRQQLLQEFDDYLRDEPNLLVQKNKKKKTNGLTFVYTGMGPQWWRMGRDLMAREEVFKNEILKCDEEFKKYAGWSLYEEMMKSEEDSKMAETKVAQPANFAIQVALTKLWESKGIVPDAIVGHSAGEIAAFYCAGVMNFEDAIKILFYRSSLQQRLTGKGKMLAVSLTLSEVKEYIDRYESVDIVAINSNSGLTIVGEESDLQEISDELTANKIFNKFLRVNVPFHSHYMEEIKDEFNQGVADVKLNNPSVTLYSSVTGQLVTDMSSNIYWWKNVRQTVLFADAINNMLTDGFDTFVEIGPHPTLSNYINQLADDKKLKVNTFSSLKRKVDETETFYGAYGALFTIGAANSLDCFYPTEGNYIKLPFYPWQREKYWLENEDARKRRLGIFDHIILGHKVHSVTPCWELELNEQVLKFIPNHKIQGNTVFPAAGYMEMAMEAAKQLYGEGYYELEDIEFVKATFINPNKATRLQIVLDETNPSFTIYNVADKEVVAKGRYRQSQMCAAGFDLPVDEVEAMVRKQKLRSYQHEGIYERFKAMGFFYTNHFANMEQLVNCEDKAIALLKLNQEVIAEQNDYTIHPAVIDACFQTVITTSFEDTNSELRLPVGVGHFSVYGKIEEKMWALCEIKENTHDYSISDISLYTMDYKCIARIENFKVNVLEASNKKPSTQTIDKWLYEFTWKEKELVRKSKRTNPWILLEDDKGIGRMIAEKLKAEDVDCYVFTYSDEYKEELLNHRITLTKDSDEDMQNAIAAVRSISEIEGIIDCLNINLAGNEDISKSTILEVGDTGVYTFISVVKALEALGVNKTKIFTVTLGAQNVVPGDEGQILQRPAWGVARLLRNQENTSFWGGVADIANTDSEDGVHQLVQDLLYGDEEDQLAYRDGKRYVGRLNNIETLTKPFPTSFSADDYYMITGAFGELGQLFVNWMVEKGVKRLVLVGRNTVPAKALWERPENDERTKARIAFVKALEDQGVEVVPVNLNMADEESVNNFFKENAKLKRKIRGIISTAGMVKDMLMTEMPKETFHQVYDVKTIGNWVLHKQFEKQPLDFFVMFSSITAMVTATGQINYISANSFLDGLAEYRRQKGLAALSVAWGPWDAGMISQLGLQETYIKKGMTPISPVNGVCTLERIIMQNIPYALVVEADWQKVIDSVSRNSNPYLDHLRGGASDGNNLILTDEEVLAQFNETFKTLEDQEREEFVLTTVKKLVGRVLHIPAEKIESEVSLNELGIDSMMSTELKNRIEMNTGAVITIVDLLNNESIAQLGQFVQSQVQSILELDTVEELAEEISDDELEALLQEVISESETGEEIAG